MRCAWCGEKIVEKDVLALNLKQFGTSTPDYYCLPCMAENLGCTVDDLNGLIEQYKNDGCTLFK